MQFDRLRRRKVLTLIGGATAAWPLAAQAQQPARLARVGFISLGVGPSANTEGFQQGLQQLGYVEGQNLVLIYRWAAGRIDRLADFARELLTLKVDLFAIPSTEAIIAVRNINKTIPVVMLAAGDPIGSGLVASFARPGGNTTGLTLYSAELAGKRLELLKELVPRLARVALLTQRDNPPRMILIEETQAAAKALRIEVQVLEVRPDEIAAAFRAMDQAPPDAVIVQQTASFNAYLRQIAELAASRRLPTVHQAREFVEAGGLIAYGPSLRALGQRAAWYVDRILKGTAPADLPIEQPSKLELVLNLKSARALGLELPPMLLARADEVIE
jgi:putative tryptophan/tyrosine transport system substrate-binding protein